MTMNNDRENFIIAVLGVDVQKSRAGLIKLQKKFSENWILKFFTLDWQKSNFCQRVMYLNLDAATCFLLILFIIW